MARNAIYVIAIIGLVFLFSIVQSNAQTIDIVNNGKALLVEEQGGPWTETGGYLEKSGQAYLMSKKSI
ncbi:hypothetical protein K8I31_17655, partial [bacterium]|nr:hypothetical protein [bacterium]